MKRAAAFLMLFVAGLLAAAALAKPPGKTTTETTGTTSAKAAKVVLCHKTGNGKWVKVTVAKSAAAARQKQGDQLPDASGNCPAPKTKTHGETTTTTP
jgi:hypothetical protein